MSKYTFTFKKDDIYVEFLTEEKAVIEKQFQIWVAAADEYAQKMSKPENVTTKKEEISSNEILESKEEPKKEEAKPAKAEVEPSAEPVAVAPEPAIEPASAPVIDKASTLLRTINTIQKEQQEIQSNDTGVDFSSVLDEKIENPTFEPTKSQDPVFVNLVKSKQTTDKFHYLMITAYYLSEFEKLDKFSLKQINSKLMQNLSEVIDHAMLQEAINQGFIEVIPDLTGIAEVAEYRLTGAGENFFNNQI